MSEFTPGPWEPVRSLTCGHLRAGHNYNTPEPKKEWADADIRLIAAAPELYEALQKVLNQSWDGPIDAEHHARKQAAAALAKARGE
jgi:hypothetical protein